MSSHALKTQPYWWEEAPPQRLQPQAIMPHCDVAIIGAGYAGLCAALHLARAGRSVQIFEREILGWGASSRNGGITSGNIRPSLSDLTKSYGAERAAKIAAEGHEARAFLKDFLREERIDCNYQPVGRFYGALTRADHDKLSRETERLTREDGIESWSVPRSDVGRYIKTDLYQGGVVRKDIGGVHPAKLQAELIRLAKEAGVVIHGETRVEDVAEGEGKHRLNTDRGSCIASEVLVCTNGYTDHSDRWLRQRLVPLRSRIVATEDLGTEQVRALMPALMMYGDTRAMTYYYRPSPDGRRILFGGRDTGFMGDDVTPTAHNLRELIRIFPQLEGVGLSHSWSGKVAMNRDMVPRIFNHGAIHYATGFCGSGVVWAPWLGLKIAKKILREPGGDCGFDFRPPGLVPTVAGKAWFMPVIFANLARRDRQAESRGAKERSERA